MKRLLFLLAVALIGFASIAQNRRYVTQNGTGNGTSWATASGNLQAMIDSLQLTGGEVWVAAGTYRGDGVAANGAFTLRAGVNVYGGFAGNEPAGYDLSLRDFNANASILDGQQKQRVLIQPADFPTGTQTVWDGFTIQNGFANNTTGAGASLRTNVLLKNCIVQYNKSTGTNGHGAIYVLATAGNYTYITDCKIANDTIGGYGGGIFATYAKIRNCEITKNLCNGEGGGIHAVSTDIYGCKVSFNQEKWGYAGGVRLENSNLINSVVNNNNGGTGGGVRIVSGGSIINCDIVNNVARNSGGGAIAFYSGVATVTNCIIWGNTNTTGAAERLNGTPNSLTYTAIDGLLYTGAGNINLASANDGTDAAAFYVRFSDYTNQDYRLQANSACVNKGINSAITEIADIAGSPRIAYETVDLGAYEYNETDSIVPSQLMAGTYTIDNTQPTQNRNYNTFPEAVNDLNRRGISGSVVFEISAGQIHNIAFTDNYGLRITQTAGKMRRLSFANREQE